MAGGGDRPRAPATPPLGPEEAPGGARTPKPGRRASRAQYVRQDLSTTGPGAASPAAPADTALVGPVRRRGHPQRAVVRGLQGPLRGRSGALPPVDGDGRLQPLSDRMRGAPAP